MAKKSREDDEKKFEYRIKLGPKHKLSISIFKNQNDDVVLNLRKFYLNDKEEWRPDKQGLTMHLEQASKLRKITKLLEEVADDAPEPDFGKKSSSKSNKGKKKSRDEDDDE